MRHPDDLIHETKQLISNLSRIQDEEFEKLVKNLNIVGLKQEWLFDYVYNDCKEETFDEYLDRYRLYLDRVKNNT